MDYSKLSDFEIDKAVADAMSIDYDIAVMFVNPVDKVNGNHVEEYVRKKITSNERHWKRFSPTKIPNDAWPIIESNRIGLSPSADIWHAYSPEEDFVCSISNPLRAAMIVFLMMQNSANVPANSTGSDLR